jgi:hypothetical protein
VFGGRRQRSPSSVCGAGAPSERVTERDDTPRRQPARTSKANGASLSVKLAYPPNALGAYANIAKVKVSGEAFPDLTIVLKGYGVTVDLVGSTQIKNGGHPVDADQGDGVQEATPEQSSSRHSSSAARSTTRAGEALAKRRRGRGLGERGGRSCAAGGEGGSGGERRPPLAQPRRCRRSHDPRHRMMQTTELYG